MMRSFEYCLIPQQGITQEASITIIYAYKSHFQITMTNYTSISVSCLYNSSCNRVKSINCNNYNKNRLKKEKKSLTFTQYWEILTLTKNTVDNTCTSISLNLFSSYIINSIHLKKKKKKIIAIRPFMAIYFIPPLKNCSTRNYCMQNCSTSVIHKIHTKY